MRSWYLESRAEVVGDNAEKELRPGAGAPHLLVTFRPLHVGRRPQLSLAFYQVYVECEICLGLLLNSLYAALANTFDDESRQLPTMRLQGC